MGADTNKNRLTEVVITNVPVVEPSHRDGVDYEVDCSFVDPGDPTDNPGTDIFDYAYAPDAYDGVFGDDRPADSPFAE